MTAMIYRPFLLIFSFAFLVSCSSTKTAKQHQQQLRYLPKEFHNTYLGMPLADFKVARKEAMLETEANWRTDFIEKHTKGDVKETTYYFGPKDKMPLYEYIIDYYDAAKRDKFVETNLGKPNSGEEWLFDSGEGFQVKAWLYQNKLVVTGIIKDTEYDEENDD